MGADSREKMKERRGVRILYGKAGETHQSQSWPEHAEAVWVDVGPEDQDRLNDIVRRLYPAHPAVVEKVLGAKDRVPGLIVEPKAVACTVHDVSAGKAGLRVDPVGLFLGRGFLVTTHLDGPNLWLDETFNQILSDQSLVGNPDMALYRYLTRHLSGYRRRLAEISREYEQIHGVMLRHPYRNLSHQILDLRRRTMALWRSTRPEREIFKLLASKDFPYLADGNRLFFVDLADRMQEVVNDLADYRGGLAEAVEAYSSLQSNEINKVMRVLTVISVLALPATTIASIYGMNFYIPEIHWRFGYYYSLLLMAVATGLVFLYMKHRANSRANE